jgi:hypothetical protein
MHDVTEIRLERRATLAFWQPRTPVGELVPEWRRQCTLGTVLVEMFKNRRVSSFRDGVGDDAGVKKICERQRDTLRPAALSRVDAAKSSSTPISRSECVSRNFLS